MKHRVLGVCLGIVLAVLAMSVPTITLAATNTSTGDVGGQGLTNGTFEVSGTQLALTKKAYLASDGSALTSGDTVPKGTTVKFMIYLHNSTEVASNDTTIQDVLDASFVYTASSMKASALGGAAATWCPLAVCDDDAIFTEVDTNGTALGDGDSVAAPTDADVGSYNSGTTTLDFGDGNNTNNAQLDVADDTAWAVVFTVTVN